MAGFDAGHRAGFAANAELAMKIDLSKFVSTDETRPHITKPFDRGAWTCASDGVIFVRVPRVDVEGIEKADGPSNAENLSRILAACDADASAAEPPPIPEGRWAKECCEECVMRGEIVPACTECEGAGYIESWKGCPVDFHGIELSGKQLRRIIDHLPNARIFPLRGFQIGFHADGNNAGIIFDGGRGILMSMKKGSIKEWKDEHAS